MTVPYEGHLPRAGSSVLPGAPAQEPSASVPENKRTVAELNITLNIEHLSPEYQKKLIDLIEEYSDCFATSYSDLRPAVGLPQHYIRIPENTPPVFIRNYRHSAANEKIIEEGVMEMVKNGILETSTSEWNSPLVLVKNPTTGKLRICVDMRGINRLILPSFFPMVTWPQILDILSTVQPLLYT